MGKPNNIARSLIISAKLRGWDPTKIEGADFPNSDYPENRVIQGDTPYLSGPLPKDPENATPNPGPSGPDNRSPSPGGQNHGTHDPYGPGKSQAGQ